MDVYPGDGTRRVANVGGARHALAASGRSLAARLVDTLLPPRCFGCGVEVATQSDLCGSCWGDLAFITSPDCDICGYPFDFEAGDGVLCGACTRRRPIYDRARSVARYDDASKRLILAFKHSDRTDGADLFGRWIARLVRDDDVFASPDLVVPVPLHRARLWRRRYNQSALLASAAAKYLGIEAELTGLVRHRNTPSQGGLTARNRFLNVRQAFSVSEKAADRFQGRRILLVDDVMTTGATIEACARVLGRAGADHVSVITLARVVRPAHNPI